MPFRLFGEPGSAAVEKERTEHDEITKIGDNDYEWSRNTRRPSADSCYFSLVSGEKLVGLLLCVFALFLIFGTGRHT